ncbi:hypothetical protein S7335_3775 [Synechococcus sp. PCC 7335]|uniref:hypothetical protein n=1 Tax=Synechococcus sp. (strain ATCC 29403 / PCC 7335) TaxID=91464 RepID=UPI00017EBC0F|nr:hypothetical protein [Synechococcus sp. PCC 7335]EDX86072.1 hypothetical protein S7335_3775 [Synechococcus sp. PCC 7335]
MIIFSKTFTRFAKSIKQAINQHFMTGRLFVAAGLVGLCLMSISAPAFAADVDYSKNSEGGIQSTERYDNIQSEKGGMNNYEAVDPRRNTNDAKAQALKDSAKRRTAELRSEDTLESVREAVDDVKSKVGDAVDSLK